MSIFESQFFHQLKNWTQMKSLFYVNIKRFYEMCIVNATHISVTALMRVSPSLVRVQLWEASTGSTLCQLVHNMGAWGILSSPVPGARDATRNVDKTSKTSFSTCNEVLKNAFVMSLLSFLLYSIQQTFIECLHHPYSFSSSAELQRATAFPCEVRDWCFQSLVLTDIGRLSVLSPQCPFTWPLSSMLVQRSSTSFIN